MSDDREWDRLTLDYGAADLYLPAKMSPEDVADLEARFALIIRRKSRNATLPSDAHTQFDPSSRELDENEQQPLHRPIRDSATDEFA